MILGMSYLELAANLTTALCIFLAGRNNIHTWWTGIVACVLFGILFFQSQLYADVTLQVFFVVTGIIGWVEWAKKTKVPSSAEWYTDMSAKDAVPISSVRGNTMTWMLGGAVLVAVGYGFLLHKFTNAYAPWIDSTVLTFSVIAQLCLMRRNIQTWPLWTLVNILSVPLYFSRELYVTSALYSAFLINAIWSWKHWADLMAQDAVLQPPVPVALARVEATPDAPEHFVPA